MIYYNISYNVVTKIWGDGMISQFKVKDIRTQLKYKI